MLMPQLASQTHIGAHVIDQHHGIERPVPQQPIHPGLQLQGGQDQRHGLPQTDRTHRGRVRQQLSTSSLHPRSAQSQQLKVKAPSLSLPLQGRDQQAALQVTGNLSGADQQSQHQRAVRAGIGPRRPGPIEASRKLQRCSAAGSRV